MLKKRTLIGMLFTNILFVFYILPSTNVYATEITNIEGVPFIESIISKNYSINTDIVPQYIIIHDTDNRDKGANAMANRNYFNTTTREASAHYLVDDVNIVQAVPDTKRAWHIGDGKALSNATNSNSIGIELCVNSDSDFSITYQNGIKLTRYLMNKYNIPIENVIRHYDATGKICPRMMIEDDSSLWVRFKEEITKPTILEETVINEEHNEEYNEEIIEGNNGNVSNSKEYLYNQPENTNGRVVIADIKVLQLPLSTSEEIGIINQGSKIQVLEKIGESYCKIKYNSLEGYIPYENVKLFEDYTFDKKGKVKTYVSISKLITKILSFGML